MSASDELASVVGDVEVGVVDGREAEQGGAVDEGEEVVDFEHEVVGELGQVFAAAASEEDLEEAGHAADGRGGEWFVDRRGLRRSGRCCRSRCLVAAGHDAVDLVDECLEGRGAPVSWAFEVDGEFGADASGIGRQHEDAIGEEDGFFDVVGDDEHGAGGEVVACPQA